MWWSLWGCASRDVQVELPDAAGLSPGVRVWVAGLDVGEVTAVELTGDRVTAHVSIDEGQDLLLHTDACAVVFPGEPPALQLVPGTEGTLDGPIPACRITREDLEGLARSAGETITGVTREFISGLGFELPAAPGVPVGSPLPLASPPQPGSGPALPGGGPALSGGGPALSGRRPASPGMGPALPAIRDLCASLSVTLDKLEPVERGFFLPDGGYAVTVSVTNHYSSTVELPAASSAVLLAGGREFSPSMIPGSQDWFMPLSIGAGATRSLRLTAGAEIARAGGTIDGMSINGVTSETDPFAECRLTASFTRPSK